MGTVWNYEPNKAPNEPGIYAVLVCYDTEEGAFPGAAEWNGERWSSHFVVAFGARCRTRNEAINWAYAHDPNFTGGGGQRVVTPKHDHRKSTWLIAGGTVIWCYQCGAWKLNLPDAPRQWHKPTGIGGPNPAMKESVVNKWRNDRWM